MRFKYSTNSPNQNEFDSLPRIPIILQKDNISSDWDGEWYYHFSRGGYADIEWVEIKTEDEMQKELVLSALRKINVPGHEIETGYRVYEYIESEESIDYL